MVDGAAGAGGILGAMPLVGLGAFGWP